MSGKAQISTYMILALLALLAAGFLFYTRIQANDAQSYAQRAVAIPRSLEPATLKTYVESCIQKVVLDPILELSALGGSLNQTRDAYRLYQGELYRYLCLDVPGFRSCANIMPLREEMEYELAAVTSPLIRDCINLSAFEEQGYAAEEGPFELKVNVLLKEVVFSLRYPLTIKKDDFQVNVIDYNLIMQLPLGEMYALANGIVNAEIQKGFFSKDEWMVKNNVSVIIEKHRPYPDIVYRLHRQLPISRNMTFKFGLKMADTVAQIGSYPPKEYAFGCCVNHDDACFKNADYAKCRDLNLKYRENKACQCPDIISIQPEKAEPPKGCAQTYEFFTKELTGPPRNHSDSWCSYDSVILTQTGKGGLAYVGSRSYKHSCIDGRESIEECRDYRDEFCTEETPAKAECRKNRWEDCYRCANQQCCENDDLRDCTWDDSLDTDNKCFPVIPPGFKFWQGNGAEVCNVGTAYRVCDGLSCPGKWIDDSAVYCYAMGDCGNYRNIADRFTTSGFFNTDPMDRPSSFIFMEPGLNINPREQLPPKKTLQLSAETRLQNQILGSYPQPASALSILFSVGLRYLDYLGRINPFDFFNPFRDPPEIRILDYSFCWNWQAPLGGSDCGKCSDDSVIPCSEYRCKSLGQLCHFEETFDGFGNCTSIQFADTAAPTIIFDKDHLNKPYEIKDATIVTSAKTIRGVEIFPRLRPYSPLKLAINTSEPTQCSLNYLPNLDLVFFPSFWFGSPNFDTVHNMSVRLPEAFSVPSKVYDTLNITSLSQIADILFNLEAMYAYYMDSYKEKFAVIKAFTGVDVPQIIAPVKSMAVAMLQPFVDQFDYLRSLASLLLGEIEKNDYYLFVSCNDRAGNRNKEDFFLKIGINTTYNDTDPPEFLGSIPDNTSEIRQGMTNVSFSLFINEPAECKYDAKEGAYDQMKSALTCPSSPYQIDPYDGGSYRCDTILPFVANSTRYFFRCKDNPPLLETFSLTLRPSTNFSLVEGREFRYLNLTQPNILDAASAYLRNGQSMYTFQDQLQLNLYVDEFQLCRYSSETDDYMDMKNSFDPCVVSDDLDIGVYRCKAVLEAAKNLTYNIACLSGKTRQRNINQQSYIINLSRAAQLKNIIIAPEPNAVIPTPNPDLVITLIKPISKSGTICGYNDIQGQGFFPMQPEGDYIYKARLQNLREGFHTYYVRCTDNSQNEFTISTTFRVEVMY